MLRKVRNMTTTPEAFFDLDDVRRMVGKWAIDCGRNVARRREALGWSREQMAGIVGTSEASIHRIESGKLNPRDHLKLAIASALAVEVPDLWPFPTRAQVYEMAGVAA